jgi:hypothetical protein
MRNQTIRLLSAAVLAGLMAAGCASSPVVKVRQPPTMDFPDGEVVLRPVPEWPQREFYDDNPVEEHVWIPAYWYQTNGRWVRIAEHWE